ncbi:CvpA family protein [Endothiovibrio diazotrophicus]
MVSMNWADYVILTIIAVSAVLSLFRGYVKETLSLVAWAAAFWVAFAFCDQGARLLANTISTPSVRVVVAFAVLFVATLLVGGLVNYLMGQLVEKTGLSSTDRMLGLVFGIVRGVAVVAIIVLLAGLTPVPRDPWWHQSQLLHHFQELALWMRGYLPPEVASYIVY